MSTQTTPTNVALNKVNARLIGPTALRTTFAEECLPWGEQVVDEEGCIWIGDGETPGGVLQKTRWITGATFAEAQARASVGDLFTVGLGTACQKTYFRAEGADLTIDRGAFRAAQQLLLIPRMTFGNTAPGSVSTIYSGSYTAVCDGVLEADFSTSELFIENNSILNGTAPVNIGAINQAKVQLDFLVDGIVRGSAVVESYGARVHRVPVRLESGSPIDVAVGQVVPVEVRVMNDNGLDLDITNGSGFVKIKEFNI